MSPRLRIGTPLTGLVLILLPACMHAPSVQRQTGTYAPPQSAADAASARFSRPGGSPYAAVQYSPSDVLPETTNVAAQHSNPPPDAPAAEPAKLPSVVQEPDVAAISQPIQRVTGAVPSLTPTAPQRPTVNTAEDAPLIQAMRSFVEKRADLAHEILQQFPAENQDALLVLLPLTVRMTEEGLRETNPQEMAAMVDQLQQLQQLLQPMATLTLDKLCFCRQIHGFGRYEPLGEHPVLHAGELVELYAEIRNLSCEQVTPRSGAYRTHVLSRLEIRNPAGGFIWKPQKREKDDYNQTPQHDYFHHYRFALPPEMPPGEYTLFLEVTDVPTGRKAKRKLDFHVNP